MSLENEINRLKRAKSNIRASLKTKIGLNIPEETKLDEYAKCIDDVESTCPHINGDFYSIRTKNGTDYSHLFNYYSGNNLDLSKWDTSKVTSMEYMFSNCNLTSLDLSNFNTSQVTNMNSIFQYCSHLTSLDLSNWDTSKVTNMDSMFNDCKSLTSLDLSSWDTSKVYNMNSMFYGSGSMVLTHIFGELDLSNLTNGFYPGSYSDPLKNCIKLETLYLKNIYKNCSMTNTSKWCINLGDTNVKDECLNYIIGQLPDLISDKKLTTTTNIILTLPKTNTLSEEQVAVAIDKGWKVANTTYNLTSYNVTYNLENIICEEKLIAKEGMPFKLSLFTIDNYYIAPVTVTMGDKTIAPTYNEDSNGFNISANITITSVTGDINIVATAKEIKSRYSSFVVGTGINKNNTLSITPINSYSVKNVLINGKPQAVPSYSYTKNYTVKDGDEIKINGGFKLYSSTVSHISNFELQSNIISMKDMFNECKNLTSLDLSNLDTSNVTNMSYMFCRCNPLISLDLSGWDTSNVTNMSDMFYYCDSLTSLDLSDFNTSNVTNMSDMFKYCDSLTSLNLSSFDTRNVTSYSGMLNGVPPLCTIRINSKTFINKSTGKTFTPAELGWYGKFTDLSIILPPEIDPIDPTDPNKPLPPA